MTICIDNQTNHMKKICTFAYYYKFIEMDSIRQKKIATLLQQEISDILLKDLRHLCGKALVTVTMVRVTADLSITRVYLSVFGVSEKQEIIDNFNRNKSEVRFLLGKRVKNQLRHIPEMQFYIDDSLDYIEKIDKALNT